MTSPVQTVAEETLAEEALTHVLDRHARRHPMVGQAGDLPGVLSIRNLLEQRARLA